MYQRKLPSSTIFENTSQTTKNGAKRNFQHVQNTTMYNKPSHKGTQHHGPIIQPTLIQQILESVCEQRMLQECCVSLPKLSREWCSSKMFPKPLHINRQQTRPATSGKRQALRIGLKGPVLRFELPGSCLTHCGGEWVHVWSHLMERGMHLEAIPVR